MPPEAEFPDQVRIAEEEKETETPMVTTEEAGKAGK
jgi:hypothetical protein